MNLADDPFIPITCDGDNDGERTFEALTKRPALLSSVEAPPTLQTGFAVARLHGFDLVEQPLVSHVVAGFTLVTPARTTVPLRRRMVGCQVVVVYEDRDVTRPIIMGAIELHPLAGDGARAVPVAPAAPTAPLHAEADGERRVIEAEREIVLRCGEASITLTRAGKVLIRGTYILSRSTGYNKIKGAAIDIN